MLYIYIYFECLQVPHWSMGNYVQFLFSCELFEVANSEPSTVMLLNNVASLYIISTYTLEPPDISL